MIIAAIAALGLHLPHPHLPFRGQPTITPYQARIGDWRVDVRQDRFAQRSTCRLFAGASESQTRVAFEDGRVVFRFSPDVETRDAVYRVDGGPARSAAPELARRPGRYMLLPSVRSTAAGYVFVPAEAVEGARAVAIRPNEQSQIRTFRVAGLSAALADVQARGCQVEPLD